MPIRTSGTTPDQFFYTGELYDNSIGLYDLRARYYNQAYRKILGAGPCGREEMLWVELESIRLRPAESG